MRGSLAIRSSSDERPDPDRRQSGSSHQVAERVFGGAGALDESEALRDSIERVIRRDRAIAGVGLAAVTLLSWTYLLRMGAGMHAAAAEADMHAAMGMPEMAAWHGAEFLMLFVMWSVMMVAMMLPSAAPVILLALATYRRRGISAHLHTLAFLGGYVAAWTLFSAAAAALQLWLHNASLLSPMMAARSVVLAGALFIAAGIYQWLPIKAACLAHCRTPIGFVTREWREGAGGAVAMGLRHGAFCVGCCWALMALLFAAGVMNLLWVAALAAFVLVEKVVRSGPTLGRAAGALLAAWGVVLLV